MGEGTSRKGAEKMRVFVDTNIFIYYFEESEEFIDGIEGFFKEDNELATSTLVIKEICWYYEKRKELEKMNDIIQKLMETGIDILEVSLENILDACRLKIKEGPIELNDLINYCVMKHNGIKTIFSTDKHFDKLRGIVRKF